MFSWKYFFLTKYETNYLSKQVIEGQVVGNCYTYMINYSYNYSNDSYVYENISFKAYLLSRVSRDSVICAFLEPQKMSLQNHHLEIITDSRASYPIINPPNSTKCYRIYLIWTNFCVYNFLCTCGNRKCSRKIVLPNLFLWHMTRNIYYIVCISRLFCNFTWHQITCVPKLARERCENKRVCSKSVKLIIVNYWTICYSIFFASGQKFENAHF